MRHAKIVVVGVAAASLWAMAVAAQPGGPPPMHGGRPSQQFAAARGMVF
jgi:hypothetical protein